MISRAKNLRKRLPRPVLHLLALIIALSPSTTYTETSGKAIVALPTYLTH